MSITKTISSICLKNTKSLISTRWPLSSQPQENAILYTNQINMGALINSPGLAEELAQLAEELMQPENSWQVKLDDQGKLIWQSGNDIRTRQPAQSFWQRVMDVFFKLFPSKYF